MRFTVTEIEHAGDMGAEIEAATVEDLFAGAIKALFLAMRLGRHLPDSELHRTESIEAWAGSVEDLLVAFLSEALFLFSVEGLVAAKVSDVRIGEPYHAANPAGGSAMVDGSSRWHASAKIHGFTYDPRAHGWAKEVKAVTYHRLLVDKSPGKVFGRVIFDL